MNFKRASQPDESSARRSVRAVALGCAACFGATAIYLLLQTSGDYPFSQEKHIYDLMWLDFWGLLLLTTLGAVWYAFRSVSVRVWLSLFIVSVGLLIVMRLLFHGTPFPENGYWGDQKFRIAMILKFLELGYGNDYYMADLPLFYPPLYYFMLAQAGKLLALPAYALQNVGTYALAFAGLPLLYAALRLSCSRLTAFWIALSSVLFTTAVHPFLTGVPHAWISNLFFIPWWLAFIVRSRETPCSIWYVLFGSIWGSVIIAVYFYPMLPATFLIVVQSAAMLLSRKQFAPGRIVRPVLVLIGSVLLSAWYWLPPFLSVLKHGGDRSRGEWHHAESTGIDLLDFNWPTLVVMIALAVLVWRAGTNKLARELLWLVAGLLLFYVIGAWLGAIDHPLNLIKSRELLQYLFAAAIGCALVIVYRLGRARIVPRYLVAAVLVVLGFGTIQGINDLATSSYVMAAKQQAVPSWKVDSAAMSNARGAVFLTAWEELPAFYPVYLFVPLNEHYAHPASQFIKRYELLSLLSRVRDPRIIWLACRHNRYTPIDYLMLERADSVYRWYVSLSHYPDRLTLQTLELPVEALQDERLFEPLSGGALLRVRESTGLLELGDMSGSGTEAELAGEQAIALLATHLDSAGRETIRRLGQERHHDWHGAFVRADHRFDSRLWLLGWRTVQRAQGIELQAAFLANRDLLDPASVWISSGAASEGSPQPIQLVALDPKVWKSGRIEIVTRLLPNDFKSPLQLTCRRDADQVGDRLDIRLSLVISLEQ